MKTNSPFKRIAIAGVGLIGGSIGLGLKQYAKGVSITGIGRNIKRLESAKKLGAIDDLTLDIFEAVMDNDLIILAQPVNVIKKTLGEISGFLKKGAVVMDVAGTKEGIIKEARRVLPPYVHFIGTHPLAGSEKAGINAASANLFKNAKCIVIKDSRTDEKAFRSVQRIYRILGASVISMNSQRHDRLLASISHFPHLAAQAMVATADKFSPFSLKLASSGFRDTTRIAMSPPQIWIDIFFENKKNLFRCLSLFENELKKIKKIILKNREKELFERLSRIKKIRERLCGDYQT